MTTEEKAKAYDEALALMVDCVPDKDGLVHVRPHEIFSELAESEDERIRKELIGFLRNIPNSNYTCEEMALWLEKQGEQNPKQEENTKKCEPFRIKKGEWYVCIHDFCNKAIRIGEIIQAEHDDTIRGIGFLYMENKYFRPAFENEKPQVDGFDAELNTLLKKYEHLPYDETIEYLKYYVGVLVNMRNKAMEEQE